MCRLFTPPAALPLGPPPPAADAAPTIGDAGLNGSRNGRTPMGTGSALLVACLLAPSATADGPPARPAFPDAVRAAVAASRVEDSDNLARPSFRDVAPDGSVLVGVEVGLARWFDSEIPYAIRPIFRQGDREWVGGTAGTLPSRKVVRVMQEAARPGYAVGGLWVRSGAGLDRLCLVYVKITPDGLDPADTYTGPWVGNSDGGGDHYIDGKGRPIVGLTADAGGGQARSLGIVTAQLPPATKKADRKPEPAPKAAAQAEPKKEGGGKADPPPTAAEAAEPKKSKLAEAAPPPEEEEDPTPVLMILIGCVVVGVPIGVFALVSMAKPAPLPDDEDDRPRRRPRRPDGEHSPSRRPDPDRPQPPKPRAEPATTDRPELARRLAPYVTPKAAPAAASGIDVAGGQAPPWFLVRATYRSRYNRMTRVYVTPTEVLMIDCGAGADLNEAAGVAAAVLAGGGVIGSFIGGAVGSMVADAGKAKGEALQQQLNRLDLAGLLELAGKHGNLRSAWSDLVGVSIDPPGFSRRGQSRAVGTFRFRSLGRGEYTFEFLNGAEVRGAVELLRRVLGPALHVGDGWDQATAVYLQGV